MPHSAPIPWWKTSPFTRLLLPLISGILLQWYAGLPVSCITGLLAGSGSALLLSEFLPVDRKYGLRKLQGGLIMALVTATGLLLVWKQQGYNQAGWYEHQYRPADLLQVEISEPPTEKDRSYKTVVNILGLVRDGQPTPCHGRVLLYLAKDSAAAALRYGDRLLVNAPLQPIKNSGNPGAFDYRQYSAFHGLFHTAFLRTGQYKVYDSGRGSPIREWIFATQQKVLAILKTYISNDELGIAEALLIGYTRDLDKDLVQAYSDTGVVHVIAVSGMHLGLIYILLLHIFKRIPYIKRVKWIQLLLTLAVLWSFSFITGASASVLRAAVMFSCIGTGKLLLRQTSVYNALAASAFILLCYDPFFLWDVGFRLSYLAVAGILLFQRPLYRLWYPAYTWQRRIWELATVSIAAQAFTFPICIWYFHQFPTAFLFSNLLVVPLSGLILYVEILLLVLALFPPLADRAGMLCSILVNLMNRFVQWVDTLPFAVWDGIPATAAGTLLLYGAVACFSVAILRKRKQWLMASFCCLMFFMTDQAIYRWRTATQHRIIVYQVLRYQAIDCVDGNTCYFIGDSMLARDGILKQFHLRPARIEMQARLSSRTLLSSGSGFFIFGSKRIVIPDANAHWQAVSRRIPVDLLLLSHNFRGALRDIALVFDCGLIVADASNSKKRIEKWKQEAEALGISFYDVASSGALEYETR